MAYEFLGNRFKDETDWRVMNYGYAFDDETQNPQLEKADEIERYSAHLYQVVAAQVKLTGAKLLDVGSGRGGGTSFVHRYFQPASTTGMDRAESAVTFCKNVYKGLEKLNFTPGDAMDMPFDNSVYDAVLNVESSHCYPDRAGFFKEVHRVLKPGGSFLYTDFFARGERADEDLKAAGFESIKTTDITGNVVRGLDMDHARRSAEIRARFPFGLRKIAALWAGTRGSPIYRDLSDGSREYHLVLAVKRA